MGAQRKVPMGWLNWLAIVLTVKFVGLRVRGKEMSDWVTKVLATEEGRYHFEREGFLLRVTESIAELMDEHGISYEELARSIQKPVGHVQEFMSCAETMSLATMWDIFHTLGRRPKIQLGDPS
jgi:hypothetical protein